MIWDARWRGRGRHARAAEQAEQGPVFYPVPELTGDQRAKIARLEEMFAEPEQWQEVNGRLMADLMRRVPVSDLMLACVMLEVLEFCRRLVLAYPAYDDDRGFRVLAEAMASAVPELTAFYRDREPA